MGAHVPTTRTHTRLITEDAEQEQPREWREGQGPLEVGQGAPQLRAAEPRAVGLSAPTITHTRTTPRPSAAQLSRPAGANGTRTAPRTSAAQLSRPAGSYKLRSTTVLVRSNTPTRTTPRMSAAQLSPPPGSYRLRSTARQRALSMSTRPLGLSK